MLRKHSHILRQSVGTTPPEFHDDGGEGILDSVFGKRVNSADATRREFLVVGLSGTTQGIDASAVQQLEDYARAVSSHKNSRGTNTSLAFWAVSDSLDDSVVEELQRPNRPSGMIFEQSEPRMTVGVRTWRQLIGGRLADLDVFQTGLNSHADGVAELEGFRSDYRRYLPVTGADFGPSEKILSPGVTGWIDEVLDDVVNVCYYDENDQFVSAEIPREKFRKFSDLRNGTGFRFQVRQEADFPDYDVLPMHSRAGESPGLSAHEFLRLSLADERLEEPGEPIRPTDWSDERARNRYLKELEEKYKGADWGRGSRK